MAWFLIVVSGLLEAAWAIGLKFSEGFTRPIPSVLTVIGIVTSLVLLALAARELPIGTAYAVWVGIGSLGAAIAGILWLGEPAGAPRLFFLGMLLIAIVGLKFTSH